jgi:hypothetical protein
MLSKARYDSCPFCRYQSHNTSVSRKLSETPAEPDQNRRSMFPMDIFS